MAIPDTKNALSVAIESRFEKLTAALDTVPPELADVREMEGHAKNTHMSANDLVAYLTGWNELFLKWLDRDDHGMPVTFPEEGYKWNELGALAQKFYADYAVGYANG